MIRKGFKVSSLVVAKIKDMVRESGILSVNDEKWPKPGPNDGAQEIEIVLDGKYLWLETCALVSRNDTMKSSDPEGLSKLHLLSEDIQEILQLLQISDSKVARLDEGKKKSTDENGPMRNVIVIGYYRVALKLW
eukprot:CAMPEP_0184018524 /NCGR_PEP_ID=MMETSP0954-20121128/8195_1 /TAXON_ID=627963 /ORGANISM="Aplanochytrium sp, Strain PBS07" /LENGTH=133 /DNA_ID=CAMNT_0026299991 /DNA_START=221 /DNA_END=620 /DNA_ORIENTATION=-